MIVVTGGRDVNPEMMEIATVVAVDMMNMMNFPVPFLISTVSLLIAIIALYCSPLGNLFFTLV